MVKRLRGRKKTEIYEIIKKAKKFRLKKLRLQLA